MFASYSSGELEWIKVIVFLRGEAKPEHFVISVCTTNRSLLSSACLRETATYSEAESHGSSEQHRGPVSLWTASLQHHSQLWGKRGNVVSPSFPNLVFWPFVNSRETGSVTWTYLPDYTYLSSHCLHYLCCPFFRVRMYCSYFTNMHRDTKVCT